MSRWWSVRPLDILFSAVKGRRTLRNLVVHELAEGSFLAGAAIALGQPAVLAHDFAAGPGKRVPRFRADFEVEQVLRWSEEGHDAHVSPLDCPRRTHQDNHIQLA